MGHYTALCVSAGHPGRAPREGTVPPWLDSHAPDPGTVILRGALEYSENTVFIWAHLCAICLSLSSHPAALHSLTPHLLLPYTVQTCFLSSVDVHTQSGYQTMLDEAVAIVMAPTDRAKRCGIFRLTTPGGLSLVQRCDRRGFHMHPETGTGQEVYELCGHVYLNGRVQHEVVDLR